MIILDNIKDISKIHIRTQEIEFSKLSRYIAILNQTYDFNMDNEWQVRKELMNSKLNIDKEFPKRYIEYLLMRGEEYKTFYFNLNRDLNRVDLIDGRRRIQAVLAYLDNTLSIFKNQYYKEFSDTDRKKIDKEVIFTIKTSELKNKIEEITYYNELNFYRENEIQNNIILMTKLPVVETSKSVIEIGTGKELKYWEYTGRVTESVPIPEWIKDRLINSGDIYYRDNHWIDKNTKKEISKGYYLNDIKIRLVKDKEMFYQYYKEKNN